MESLRTLDRRPLLTVGDGRFLAVESHTVAFPGGHIVEDWGWVITPDYINVVAVTAEGRFLCFRQPKYAVTGLSLSVTGGYIEPGEEPLAAAQRELLEETGYVAAAWRTLGSYAVDGNRGVGTAHFFLATGVRWQQPSAADDLEAQEFLLLERAEVDAALLTGEFKVLPWAANVALALLLLDRDLARP
jgi:ADP-ribose pyrophosphatase